MPAGRSGDLVGLSAVAGSGDLVSVEGEPGGASPIACLHFGHFRFVESQSGTENEWPQAGQRCEAIKAP